MRKYFILYFIIFSPHIIHSQKLYWNWAITDKGQSSEVFDKFTVDHKQNIIVSGIYFDGDFKFCGAIGLLDNNLINIFFTKTNHKGACLWSQIILAENPNNPITACDSNNNIYMTFSYAGKLIVDGVDISSAGLNRVQACILKFDPDGNLIWYKILKTNDPSREGIVMSGIEVDRNDNIYIIGNSQSKITSIDSFRIVRSEVLGGSSPTFLCKLNTSGLLQWGIISNGNCDEESYGLNFDRNNLPIISGRYTTNTNKNAYMQFDSIILKINDKDYNIFIFKFDQDGKVVFGKSIGGSANEYGAQVAVDNDNNIYLSGVFYGEYFIFAKDTHWSKVPAGNNIANYLLLKMDPIGNEMWANSYWLGQHQFIFYNLHTDDKNNVYLHLNYSEDKIKIGNNILELQGEIDNLLLKYTSDNKLLYALSYGTPREDFALFMHVIQEDEIILSGIFTDSKLILGKDTLVNEGIDIGSSMPTNFYIAKISPDSTTGTKDLYDETTPFNSIYPNPADEEIIIDLGSKISSIEKPNINLINLEGKSISMNLIPEAHGIWKINTKAISDGMYILQIKWNHEEIKSRIVVSH